MILVLTVAFTTIYATLFYVHKVLCYLLQNRISSYHCEKIVICFSLKKFNVNGESYDFPYLVVGGGRGCLSGRGG